MQPGGTQLAHLTAQLDDLRARGTYFKLRVLDDEQGAGLPLRRPRSHQPRLEQLPWPVQRRAPARGRHRMPPKKYGVGSGAVRTIAGTMRIHMELEEKIAAFKGR